LAPQPVSRLFLSAIFPAAHVVGFLKNEHRHREACMPTLVQKWVWIGLVLALIGQALGQGGATGAITGTVEDPSGAVLAGADVRILNQDTGALTRSLKTDANGSFTATLLPVGSYTVTVTSGGFQEAKFSDIPVRVTETTRMTAKLRPQAVQEKIDVQAEVQAVDTTTATTGEAVDARTVRELPLATQNFQQLLSLSTGAQSDLNSSAQLGRGNVRILVNGQREDNNNYLIEGISATDYNVAQSTNVPLPNPDVIGEFKVQTSLYDATQGRNGGGNVNAILKSGTKNFHGDVYEFFRNDVLNANEYFVNRAGLPRPPVKQNIFGGSLGGPLGPNAKLGFFFVNYQGTRQRSGLSPGTLISANIPVLPSTRTDATLDATLQTLFGVPSIDPVIHKLLLFQSDQFGSSPGGFLIPSIPGVLGSTGQFIVSKPGRYSDDQFTTNWDREFRGGNDKISARFFFSNAETFLPFGAGGLQLSLGGTLQSAVSASDLNFPYDLPVNDRFFSINETHLFSPAVVNDFRFGLVRINNTLGNIPPVTASDLGIDRPTNSVTSSIYKFSLFGGSGFQIGPTPPADQSQNQNTFNFVDTLSWVRGAHVWRFGGEYTRVNLDKLFPQVFNGQLFFVNGGGFTDFQKFLMGAPDFSFGGGGVYNHQYRTNDFAFFAQDDWKARNDFTVNLGLRVEVLGAFYDKLCHIGNLDPDLASQGQYPFIYGNCAKGLNVAGLNPTGSDTTYKRDYATGWGPRIGFAWDLFGHHTTAIRGGYGIYYVREDVGSVDQLSFQAPFLPVAFGPGQAGCLGTFFSSTPLPGCPSPNPNALPQAGVIDPNFVPCLGILQGFAGNDPNSSPSYACNGPGIPSTNIFGLVVPRRFVTPNTQQWNLTVQRELGRNWVLEVGYVGTHAIHLRETRTNLSVDTSPSNPLVLTAAGGQQFTITANTFANGPARSRAQGINGYSGMQLFANDAYSHYHSLQTTLSRRWGAGYFQGAYTFSRSTDATSSGNTALNTAFNDETSLDASRGLSDFDRTHRFVVSYRYDLPFFKDTSGATAALLRDWAISGITVLQSGLPFSVTDSGAGTGFLGPGLTPLTLGASLASGGSIKGGTTSGDIHKRIDGYLNIENFTSAPFLYPAQCANDGNFCTTDFGNLGRNIYRGPFQQNWDFSLLKNFRITERQTLRFTADFFNIWNHTNFGNPTITDVESTFCQAGVGGCPPSGRLPQDQTAFGKIVQSVGTPRLIQLSLRWAF
jgi:hypothetical protein